MMSSHLLSQEHHLGLSLKLKHDNQFSSIYGREIHHLNLFKNASCSLNSVRLFVFKSSHSEYFVSRRNRFTTPSSMFYKSPTSKNSSFFVKSISNWGFELGSAVLRSWEPENEGGMHLNDKNNNNEMEGNNKLQISNESTLNSSSSSVNKLSSSAQAVASQKAHLLKARLLRRGINSELSFSSSPSPPSSSTSKAQSSFNGGFSSSNDYNNVNNMQNDNNYNNALHSGHIQSSSNSSSFPPSPSPSNHGLLPPMASSSSNNFNSDVNASQHFSFSQSSPSSSLSSSSSSSPPSSTSSSSSSSSSSPSIFPDDPEELVKMLQMNSEDLFQEIISKQREMEELTQEERKIQEAFKSETESEIDQIKNLLLSREKELATMVKELQEAQSKFADMQTKAVAELAIIQQEVAEKDLKLALMEEALSKLKPVNIEYWGEGDAISVAGSFNGWQCPIDLQPDFTSHITKGDGSKGSMMWESELWLYPGTYEIKFIVDGNWVVDQRRETVMTNMGRNNIILVDE